ncbi:MAG: DNA polymerase III subunit alpha [bacterium]
MSITHCDFVHLHNHSEYSMLDGANRVRDLVSAARACGMPALALTDHGAMHGAIEFYKACHAQGVKPILGCEVYITTGSRHDRTPASAGGPATHHLVLLARDKTGYRNLMKLTSKAYLEGFYYRPRIDRELLEEHGDGLIALTACLKGEVPSALLAGKEDKALEILGFYQEILGRENVYLEVQDHDIDEERRVVPLIRRLAERTGTKVVATNDCHYMTRDHAESQDLLICIGTGKEYDDPKRLRMSTAELYFKTPEQMKELFADLPEAVTNTVEVAERCNVDLELGHLLVPRFPLPDDVDDEHSYLERLSWDGLRRRVPDFGEEYKHRLEFELQVIAQMGYSGYFLIVRDFVQAAKDLRIPVGPGRGSAAGSLVSWVLGITNLDPIANKLLFERFLNPERVSMPDIDIDFCFERRSEIIDYVVRKYGKESVTQIITFGRMAARAALRDVGRVLKVPFADMDRIAKMVPADPGMTLAKAFEQNPDLGRLEESDPTFGRVLKHARALEGLARHASTHAAGVVVAPGDLTDHVPLYVSNKKEITTQYDMKWVEEVGLLKMDFLGLRTLTVIHRATEMVAKKIGQELTPDDIPMDDPVSYDLLCRAETIGVFQFESSGMRSLLKAMRPSRFEDVVAATALYRPGPLGAQMDKTYIDRKHEREAIEVLHPTLEPILRETYGVILYQEQVMAIAAEMAGFSLGEADLLRRAMGKKKPEEMEKQQVKFVAGCKNRDIDEGVASRVFELMAYFAGYGFNKSHSAAYAVLSVQTAWLKAKYPEEFLAATLTSEMNDSKRVPVLIEEARRMGIPLEPPDINRSESGFSVKEGSIVFGLAAVRNVGVGAVERILEVRAEGGPFEDLYDFVTRIDLKTVNRRMLESLAQAGAFDAFGRHRAEVFESIPMLLEVGNRVRLERERGQTSLFANTADEELLNPFRDGLPEAETWSPSQLLTLEKEALGVYYSGHPLDRWGTEVRSFATARVAELEELADGRDVVLGGLVTGVRVAFDKRGNRMAFLEIEDFTGTVEAIVFSEPMQRYADCFLPEQMLLVGGTLSLRDEGTPKLLADRAIPLDQVAERIADRVFLDVMDPDVDESFVERLTAIGKRRLGSLRTVLRIGLRDGNLVRVEVPDIRLPPTKETIEELEELVGEGGVRLGGHWAPERSENGRRWRGRSEATA